MSEYKHVNVKLSVNLNMVTIETEVEQISISKFNIKINNLLHNINCFLLKMSFINFTVFKIKNK